MAVKKYVIEVEVDTDFQSLGDVEFFLDSNSYDWDLREEYTIHEDICDICGQPIEGGSRYLDDENEHVCEECFIAQMGEPPTKAQRENAEARLIEVAKGYDWVNYEIKETSNYGFPYGLEVIGYSDKEFKNRRGSHVVNMKDY